MLQRIRRHWNAGLRRERCLLDLIAVPWLAPVAGMSDRLLAWRCWLAGAGAALACAGPAAGWSRRCCWLLLWAGLDRRHRRLFRRAARSAGASWRPAISPGKTWEGVAGAAAAVAVYHVALSHRDASLAAGGAAPAGLILFAVLAAVQGIVRRPVRIVAEARRRASRTAAACCPATAACSTASTR